MPCSVTLSNYSLSDCFSSKGGIKAVWVAVYQESGFTISTADTVTGFATGITWFKQELRKNTGSMTSTYNYDEANGISYVQTDAVFQYGKMDKENRIQMNALAKGDLMVVVEDCNGEYYALGTEEAVKATAGTGQTGTNRTDGNYFEVTLSDFCADYPPHLDATAIELLP